MVVENYNGKIVKEFLPEEMAKTIINYHKMQDLLENQKKNALLSIQKYDLNTVTNSTIKIYQNLVSK